MSRREELDHKILAYLFRHGHAPRPELVAYTGIRAATVFESVDRLKSSGLLIEPARRGKKTGRKAPELECNPDIANWIGIDLNTRKTTAVRTDNNGSILDREEITASNRNSAEDVFTEIFSAVSLLKQRAGKSWFKVCGAGFSDPGPVDLERGVSLNAVNIPGWNNIDTASRITGETGVPCGVWAGEMVRAHMEYISRGKASPARLVHICLGNTIGAGFVADGRIYYGATGNEMEIGHLIIQPDGPVCSCGNRGCLEAVASIPALKKRFSELLQSGQKSDISEEDFSIEALFAAKENDMAAKLLAEELASAVGKALIPVVTLLNPDMIILSGETAQLKDKLRIPILDMLKSNSLAGSADSLAIEFSFLSGDDTARGAALLMRDKTILSQMV